jgi:hypothetical protein
MVAWGKFIASLTMVVSILTIALPTSIIGSNFMAEWQIFQRLQLQKKMRKNRQKYLSPKLPVHESDIRSIGTAHYNDQDAILLQIIGEIQEKLSDVNPPQYYQRYKHTSMKYERAQEEIVRLKNEIQKLRKFARENQGKHKLSTLTDVIHQKHEPGKKGKVGTNLSNDGEASAVSSALLALSSPGLKERRNSTSDVYASMKAKSVGQLAKKIKNALPGGKKKADTSSETNRSETLNIDLGGGSHDNEHGIGRGDHHIEITTSDNHDSIPKADAKH